MYILLMLLSRFYFPAPRLTLPVPVIAYMVGRVCEVMTQLIKRLQALNPVPLQPHAGGRVEARFPS